MAEDWLRDGYGGSSGYILGAGLPRRATVFSVETAANEVEVRYGGVPKKSLKKPTGRESCRSKERRDQVPRPLSLTLAGATKPMYPDFFSSPFKTVHFT